METTSNPLPRASDPSTLTTYGFSLAWESDVNNTTPRSEHAFSRKRETVRFRSKGTPGAGKCPGHGRGLRPPSRPLFAGLGSHTRPAQAGGRVTRSPCSKGAWPFLSTCPAAGGNIHLCFPFQPPKGPEGTMVPRPGHHGGFSAHTAEPDVCPTVFGRKIISVFGTLFLGPEAMSFPT